MRIAKNFGRLLVALVALVGAAQAQNVPPEVRLELERTSFATGEDVAGTLVVTFGPELHAYQNPPSEDWMIPVKIVAAGDGTVVARVDYPKGSPKQVGGMDEPALVYGGEVRIPVVLRASSAATDELRVAFTYQQCDAQTCFPPVTIEVGASVEVAGGAGGQEATPTAANTSEAAPAEGIAGFLHTAMERGSYLPLIGALLLVGLLINLTPCVYPMIPITLGFFSSQTAGSRSGRLGLGLMYMLGIAGSYGLTGGIAAGVGASFGVLFTQAWFNWALAGLMVFLALSMFDVYQIGIPGPLQRQLKGRSGPVGALIMGTLVGVAAAPCAGPAIVAIFAEVAKTQSAGLGVLVFGMVGVGIGAPYVVLAAMASGAGNLPKAGGWMKLVKAALGLVVLAVGLSYALQALGPSLSDATAGWVRAGFLVGAIATMLFFQRAYRDRASVLVRGVTVLTAFVLVGAQVNALLNPPATIEWTKLTEESFDRAARSGRTILVDATANWCAECRVIDNRVFRDPDVVRAARGLETLKIDWSTGVDPAYVEWTAKRFGIQGLPHIMVFDGSGRLSSVHNSLESKGRLFDALRKAGAKL